MFFHEYKTILSPQNGINIYRGCTHGCIYCDSRSECYQMNHAFEDIEVKTNAPEILDRELAKKKHPIMVGTGAMSDPYCHVEEDLQYTRKCLEVIKKHHCGVAIQTKSTLILRDMDLLDAINKDSKAVVQVTLTTADDNLCRIVEPNVAVTSERVEILKRCKELGIPTVVWLCPFLPYINDNMGNISKLMDICIKHGVKGILFFGIGLTLRKGNREYYYAQLDRHFPGLKEKYIQRYGDKYEVSSPNWKTLQGYIVKTAKEHGIMIAQNEVFAYMKEYPIQYGQLSLF